MWLWVGKTVSVGTKDLKTTVVVQVKEDHCLTKAGEIEMEEGGQFNFILSVKL